MSALLLAAGVWGAHYAYYRWPDLTDRAWAQYIGVHLLVVIQSLLLAPMAKRLKRRLLATLALAACYLGAIESAQCVTCGVLEWGHNVNGDLCIQAFGAWPYAMAAAALGATLFTVRWRARHG